LKALLNSFTCLLFGLILIAPVTLTVMDTELTAPLEENRLREDFPDMVACNVLRFDRCFKRIDSWFNDNYGPRDLLIKLKTQIDYSVFSTSDKVHIGSNDWLFYRSTMDTQKVMAERLPQAEFDNFLAEIDALDRYLQSRNILLVVLPIPLKDVIYHEHLPSSAPNLPGNSRYQQLRQWLAEHESIITVDAYDHLSGRKEAARAFHKTDFHWNDPAGFLYAEKLVNKLWQVQSGQSGVLWDRQLSIVERPYSGGQANFLPLLRAPSERGLFLDVTWEPPKGAYTYNGPDGFWNYIYDGTDDERGQLGRVVVMGDSFFDALHRSGIDSYFSSVHRSGVQPAEFSRIYTEIPEGTRFFIFEFIETGILHYSLNDISVPDE
jgi:hypothetical protein